jgi:riboflavin biosynthesis pyrimidine reductase
MRLDGSSDFSTFRLTLGSVLAEPLGLEHADDPGLTVRIEDHLSAVTVAVDDAGNLMALEHQVLQQLDPPLNLMGMPSTPVRHRLSELRRLGRRGKQS